MNELVVEQAIKHVLDWEGGFVDHPDDAGGATNFGITMPTLSKWLGRPASHRDIRELSHTTAVAIYERFYVRRYDKLKDPWTFKYTVDMGVLHSPRTVAKITQKAAYPILKIDGIYGPKTFRVINQLSMVGGIHANWQFKLRRERSFYYARRVRDIPSQASFVLGWMKRAHDL